MTTFEAEQLILKLLKLLRRVLEEITRYDRPLADQARRAGTSAALNISEGMRRTGKDRLHLWRVAAGSAAELRTALQIADAWGYVASADLTEPLALLDRVLAMLWRMTHPRPPLPAD